MASYRKGDAVTHPAYGRGSVNGTRIDGFEVRVSFGAYSLWVPARELTPASGGLRLVGEEPAPEGPHHTATSFDAILRLLTGQPAPTTRTEPAPAVPPQAHQPAVAAKKSRKHEKPTFRPAKEDRAVKDATAIEAFRLGIVPARHIEDWTVGREVEVKALRTFLKDEAEGAILIEGQYGAGKSHLLAFMAREAESMGFAVATAGFDPSEASAAFPKKAYRRLCQGFRAQVDGQPVDFRGFLTAVASKDNWGEVLGDHWLLGAFLKKVAAGKADSEDWEHVEALGRGEDGRPTLHDYSTCANLYVNLLSALSLAAAEVLGMNGLAVLLDEAEVARNVLYRYQAQRGVNFFRGLVLSANDDPDLLEEAFVREDVTVGAQTRLLYSGHNPARYTAGIPCRLKVAFALTPGSLQDEFRRTRESIGRVELDVLSMDALKALFWKIHGTYEACYGVRLDPKLRDRVFRLLATAERVSSTRGFIKAAVEALDYARFFPQGDIEAVILDGVG
jgi:hypothetical protein